MNTHISITLQPTDGGSWTHKAITVFGWPPVGETDRIMAADMSFVIQRRSFEVKSNILYIELHPMMADHGFCSELAGKLTQEGWK